MTREEAIRIFDPVTTAEALAETPKEKRNDLSI